MGCRDGAECGYLQRAQGSEQHCSLQHRQGFGSLCRRCKCAEPVGSQAAASGKRGKPLYHCTLSTVGPNADAAKQLQGVRTFASHASHIHALAWQPDSEHHVVTASMDKTLKLWDLRAAVPLHTLEGHTAQVNGVVCLLVSAGCLQRAFSLALGSAQVLCATWWEGSKIVSGSADNTVRVYETAL